MKKFLFFATFSFAVLHAQDGPYGGEFKFNPENINCLTEEKSQEIQARILQMKQDMIAQGKLSENALGGHPLFQWPVTKNPSTPYNNVWSISNHVDHNPSFPNQVLDWNCGNRTYDTNAGYNHKGIDIYTWPFSWYQMANNHSWAVAAAPGIIIGKDNGNADTSCAMNGGNWNAVYVAHSDGSVSWYGHLKNNSLTTKLVGEAVDTGEYLGVVGSSGNSTGPHLHFEVYNASNNLVDTYTGTCNTWPSSTDSWWQSQRPYIEPKVNAVFTHSAPPSFPICPQVEGTFFKNEFSVGETVYCAGYFADQNVGMPALILLLRPDGTAAFSSGVAPPELFYSSYWYWAFTESTLNQIGIWTVVFQLDGNQHFHQFAYGTTLESAEFDAESPVTFYPNPARNLITFSKPVHQISAYGIDGKSIELSVQGQQADVSTLPDGMFILKGKDADGQGFTCKLIK